MPRRVATEGLLQVRSGRELGRRSEIDLVASSRRAVMAS